MIVLSSTIIYSLFSSDAWNNVTFIAGEIRNPEKNIPRSLALGTIIVTVLYLLANLAYLSILPLYGNPEATTVESAGILHATNDRVGSAAAFMIFGDVAEYMMAALIMISTFGCNNGLIMAGSRLYYSMATHHMFLKKAGKLNSSQVPGNALWMQCIWAGALCLTGVYSSLVAFCTFASLLFYIVCILALFKLRKTEPHTPRPYKALGYPVIPALYILFTTLICVALVYNDFLNSGLSLLCIVLGFPVYFLFFRNSEASGHEKIN
jgi:APA family basic amino acid/polyamine antiporter